MIKGDYDKLRDIAKNNVCAEHKTLLVVARHSGEKCWTLRCDEGVSEVYVRQKPGEAYQHARLMQGHYPDAVTRQLSLTEMHQAGEELPGHIEDQIIKKQRRKAMTQGKDKQDFLTALVPHVDLGTGELLSDGLTKGLVVYAEKYALDPYRSHVVLMYGKPYITIDGYLYHARQTKIPYTLQSRPMTTKEEAQYKVGKTDHVWLAKVIFTETGDEFTGMGVVTYEEMTAKSPRDQTKLRSPVVAAHPWQLAQKRAEWQALRRAFPIGESEANKEKEEVNVKD